MLKDYNKICELIDTKLKSENKDLNNPDIIDLKWQLYRVFVDWNYLKIDFLEKR